MFESGLVSISLRKHSPAEIIRAASEAGLGSIEWGGDIHVPAGDLENARNVARMTRDAGISVAAYGSYYKLGQPENTVALLEATVMTAAELGAPVIRVWAGAAGSREASAGDRERIVRDGLAIADLAETQGITVAAECHGGTLTDDWESTLRLLDEINHPGFKTYWQPNQHQDEAYNLKAAEMLAPQTVNLHVFHWDSANRYPLIQGTDIWARYLKIFAGTGRDYRLLLEFMHDDRIESLTETAKALRGWIFQG